MLLSERITAIESPIARELLSGLYDDFANALEIPNSLIDDSRYHGSVNDKNLDSGHCERGEHLGVSSVARINVLETLYLEFPEMGNRIPQNIGIGEIRRILEEKRNEREDLLDDEQFEADLERRLSQYESDNETDIGIVYTEIDYAARDRAIIAFGNLLDHLQDPDIPELNGTQVLQG